MQYGRLHATCILTTALLQAVAHAKSQLSIAIAKSHGSDTATWLNQAAEACLNLGLEASTSRLQLKPVSFQAVIVQMKTIYPTVKHFLAKFQGSTGQKYFSLFGPAQAPTTMLLKLHSIILTPGRTASVLTLLQSIDVASGGSVSNAAVLRPLPQSYMSGTTADASAMPKVSIISVKGRLTCSVSTTKKVCMTDFSTYTLAVIISGQICELLPPVVTKALHAQEAEAKRQLKAAVQAQHAGSTNTARFTAAIASAAIELGLKSSSSQAGFVLTRVVFTKVGLAIAGMKKQTPFASKSISDIYQQLDLQQYFSFVADAKSEKHLTMHIAALLPHPSSTIRSLLPHAPWSMPSLSPTASTLALPAAATTSSSLQALCADSSPGPVVSRSVRLTKAKQNAQGSARSGQADDPLQNGFSGHLDIHPEVLLLLLHASNIPSVCNDVRDADKRICMQGLGQALSVDTPGPTLCVLVQRQAPTSASIAQRVAVVCNFEGSDAPDAAQADTLCSIQVRA